MRLSRLLIFALLFVAICFMAFEFTRPSYPVIRQLENQEGKIVEGVIEGKVGDVIYFDRSPSGQRYGIATDSLSWKDRLFAMRLRESAPPVKTRKIQDRYIQVRQKEISELREKAKVISDEISSFTLNDVLHQNRIDQLSEIEEEIRSLELAIKTYNYRMKK